MVPSYRSTIYILSNNDLSPIDDLVNASSSSDNQRTENLLQLNKDETEIVLAAAGDQRQEIQSKLVSLSLKPSEQARNLAVTLIQNSTSQTTLQV